MPIPAGGITKLRGNMQTTQPVINYFPAQTVAVGSINFTPTTYPIGSVGVNWSSGTAVDIRVGQLFVIRASDEIVSYGVVRLAYTGDNTTGTLFIDGKSRGDAGLAVRQEFAITAGHVITIYTFQPLWSLLSRIKDGVFYKKFDVPYDGSGSNPAPVLNIGSWRQVWADDLTGLGRLTFTSINSFAWLGRTVADTFWILPAGATIVSGVVYDDTITIDLPQGFHIIRCQIHDSEGIGTESMRPIWVNGDDFLPMSSRYGFEIGGDSQSRTGRNTSYTFNGQITETDLLPGAAFHMSEIAYFDSQPMNAGVLVDTHVGFSNEIVQVEALPTGEQAATYTVNSPFDWMSVIPMVSQAIVEVASPAAWTDVATGLGIPNFIAYYILKHHTTYLEMFDYFPLTEDNPPRKLNWGVNGSTVTEYLTQCASVFGGNIGCISDGSLYLRRDPNLESTGFRDLTDVRMTLTIDPDAGISDVTAPPEINQSFFNQSGQIRLFALMYDGTTTTAVASIAPGFTQMQAAGSQDEDSFIVKPTPELLFPGGQDAVNHYCGHSLARMNNPTKEISLALNRNMDVADPAKMLWFRVEIPAEWSPRGKALSTRVLPVSVDRAWEQTDGGGWVKNITMVVCPETFGQPGETFLLDQGGGSIYAPEVPPVLAEEQLGLGFLAVVDDQGSFGRSFDGISWSSIQGNMLGLVQDYALNNFSPYVLSGYAEGALGAWAMTARETSAGSDIFDTVSIYYTENVLASSVVWALQYSVDAGEEADQGCRIASNPEIEGYIGATINTANGSFVLFTLDGATWDLEATGDTDPSAQNRIPADLAWFDKYIVTSGYNTGLARWRLVYFDVELEVLSAVASAPSGGSIPWPMISTDSTGVTYASQVIQSTTVTSRTYQYRPNASTGVPEVTVVGGTGSIDDIEVTFVGTPADDPLDDIESGSHYGGTWDACGIGAAGAGWILKTSGESVLSEINAMMTINIKGKATVSNAEILGRAMSKSTDPSNYAYVGQFYRTIGVLFYEQTGNLVAGILHNIGRSGEPSACPLMDFDWTDWGGTLENISKIQLIFQTHPLEGISSPTSIPYYWQWGRVTMQDVLVEETLLYRIDDFTAGSPSWDDITPADNTVPRNPYSLSSDDSNEDLLNTVIMGAGGDRHIALSDDRGDTWLIDDNVSYYYGLRQIDVFGLIWGYNYLAYTDDGFDSVINLFGNWQVTMDDGGMMKILRAAL